MGTGQQKGNGPFGRDFEADHELDEEKQLILPSKTLCSFSMRQKDIIDFKKSPSGNKRIRQVILSLNHKTCFTFKERCSRPVLSTSLKRCFFPLLGDPVESG